MRQTSINIVQLAVALFCVVVLVTVMVVVTNANTRHRHPHRNSSQLRGIHQGLVTFANSNKNWFPGIHPDGTTLDLSVEFRFQTLIEDDYITPEYAISHSETEKIEPWEDMNTPITKNNYSFAMLQLPEDEDGRRHEWAQTLNSQAIVVSDRNRGSKNSPSSIHTNRGDKDWSGRVLWNDNHVQFEHSDVFETKYGSGQLNLKDQLFESNGLFDAFMINSAN
ncbi:MAG: hypothetical protein ACPG4Q_16025 [Phycisphaeraceae bacterium]